MWKQSVETRLQKWKRFRVNQSTKSLAIAIQETCDLWATTPFTPFFLDPAQPSSWPDPWTLISDNYYCDLARVLGIVYTLMLSDHATNLVPEIRVYTAPNTQYNYIVAWFNDGEYIVNVQDHEVLNLEQFDKNLVLKFKYGLDVLNLEK